MLVPSGDGNPGGAPARCATAWSSPSTDAVPGHICGWMIGLGDPRLWWVGCVFAWGMLLLGLLLCGWGACSFAVLICSSRDDGYAAAAKVEALSFH